VAHALYMQMYNALHLALIASSKFNQWRWFGDAAFVAHQQPALAASILVVVGRRKLRELALIRDANPYEPSAYARTAGSTAQFIVLCHPPASSIALPAGRCMRLCLLMWLRASVALFECVGLDQPAQMRCISSVALVQSWEDYQRGLVARARSGMATSLTSLHLPGRLRVLSQRKCRQFLTPHAFVVCSTGWEAHSSKTLVPS
jgi:hypothetical protein